MQLGAHDCAIHKVDDLLGGITLAQFIAGEGQVLRLRNARMKVLLAAIPDWVQEAYEDGNILQAANYIRNSLRVAWSDAEINDARRVHRSLLYLGAAADSKARAKVWKAPKGEDAKLVEAAVIRFMEDEEDMLYAMADGLYREGSLLLEPVAKDELVPRDFGYKPTLERPPWARALGAAGEKGITSSTLSANLTTSRLVNYGALDSMVRSGASKYRLKAKLDGKTSKICRELNGRVFNVKEGLDQLQKALMSRNGGNLKDLHPWVKAREIGQLGQMTVDALRARGYRVPPFHPHCRTVVVRATPEVKRKPGGGAEAEAAAQLAEAMLANPAADFFLPATELARSVTPAAILDDFALAVRNTEPGKMTSPALQEAAERRFAVSDFDTAAKELAYRAEDKGLRAAKPANLKFARQDVPAKEREWLILMGDDGLPLGAPNPGTSGGTGLSPIQQGHVNAAARGKPRTLEVHHNHPKMVQGRPIIYGLSPQDYKFVLSNKGVKAIYAHIDEGISFRMAWNPVVEEEWFKAVFSRVQHELWNPESSQFVRMARAFLSEVKDSRLDGHDLQALAQIAYGNVLRNELGMSIDYWGPELRQWLVTNYRAYQVMESHMTRLVREVLEQTPGSPLRKEDGAMYEIDEGRELAELVMAGEASGRDIKEFGAAGLPTL